MATARRRSLRAVVRQGLACLRCPRHVGGVSSRLPPRAEPSLGILYLVATPIGNLEDVTRRAARVLGDVDRVLAEDTRRTRVLLDHLGISVPVISLHEHNEAGRTDLVLEWLAAGDGVALVSDAGTPLVSDPGALVVSAAAAAGHRVVPIPGPSAVLAALVASTLPTDRFTFLGFVPRKGEERTRFLERIAGSEETVVLFESAERLGTLLAELAEACGGERRVAVGRELTKMHEEFTRGTLSEVLRYYQEHAPRGEVTVVVERAAMPPRADAADRIAARSLAHALIEEGLSPSRAAREVARRLGLPRNLVYEMVQALEPAPDRAPRRADGGGDR